MLRPGTPGRYPEPSGIRTVVAGVGRDEVLYTAARHWLKSTNRFGQNSAEFPFCLVNLPAWRRAPCDLRLARWYRTEQEAIEKYALLAAPEPEPSACGASFGGGVVIEIRSEHGGRWRMSEVRFGRRARRPDFATPFLDHAKRTAAH